MTPWYFDTDLNTHVRIQTYTHTQSSVLTYHILNIIISFCDSVEFHTQPHTGNTGSSRRYLDLRFQTGSSRRYLDLRFQTGSSGRSLDLRFHTSTRSSVWTADPCPETLSTSDRFTFTFIFTFTFSLIFSLSIWKWDCVITINKNKIKVNFF